MTSLFSKRTKVDNKKIRDQIFQLRLEDPNIRICDLNKKLGITTARDHLIALGLKTELRPGYVKGRTKLTEEQVLEIYSLFDRGLTPRTIADKMNLQVQRVRNIVKGNSWKKLYRGLNRKYEYGDLRKRPIKRARTRLEKESLFKRKDWWD